MIQRHFLKHKYFVYKSKYNISNYDLLMTFLFNSLHLLNHTALPNSKGDIFISLLLHPLHTFINFSGKLNRCGRKCLFFQRMLTMSNV